jgi:hypothetical protein
LSDLQRTSESAKTSNEKLIASLTAELATLQEESKQFQEKYLDVVNELEAAHKQTDGVRRELTVKVRLAWSLVNILFLGCVLCHGSVSVISSRSWSTESLTRKVWSQRQPSCASFHSLNSRHRPLLRKTTLKSTSEKSYCMQPTWRRWLPPSFPSTSLPSRYIVPGLVLGLADMKASFGLHVLDTREGADSGGGSAKTERGRKQLEGAEATAGGRPPQGVAALQGARAAERAIASTPRASQCTRHHHTARLTASQRC